MYKWQICIEEDAQHHISPHNCKLKRDTTSRLLEWLKSKMLTIPNTGKDVEQQELSFIPRGVQNGTATLEVSLVVSYRTKNTLAI